MSTQLDTACTQAESSAKSAMPQATTEKESLVDRAARLAGKSAQTPETCTEPQDKAPTQYVTADGYVRRTPVQPVREAADYRRRLAGKIIGAAVLLAAVIILFEVIMKLGLFGW